MVFKVVDRDQLLADITVHFPLIQLFSFRFGYHLHGSCLPAQRAFYVVDAKFCLLFAIRSYLIPHLMQAHHAYILVWVVVLAFEYGNLVTVQEQKELQAAGPIINAAIH